MTSSNQNNALWQFMLNLYAKDGVKELCLGAQNEHGIDVLLLLMDAGLQQQQCAWPDKDALQDYIEWREQMIVPLRALRMILAKDEEPLRTQLLTAELSAEKQGVQLLFDAQANSVTVSSDAFLDKDFIYVQPGLANAQEFYVLFTQTLSSL